MSPPQGPIPWWMLVFAALALLGAGYACYRGLCWLWRRLPQRGRFAVARQYRHIRANQGMMAQASHFPEVKAAWLALLAYHGLHRQPTETLVQLARRQPAGWAAVRG